MLYIGIWGAGRIGQECLEKLEKYISGECFFFFVDSDPKKAGTKWCGKPVYDISELTKRKNVIELSFICVAVPEDSFNDVKKKIGDIQLIEKVVYYTHNGFTPVNILMQETGKPVLPYVETHVYDGCNLRCKGCGHLSNIAPPKEADFNGFCFGLKRLKELFADLEKLRLMGGEPFLNEHIYEYVEAARDIWQNTDIRIVTNGLLLNQDKVPLLKKISKLDVQLDISAYPATLKKNNEIDEIVRKAGIGYHFTDPIKVFMRFRSPEWKRDCKEAYKQCSIKQCHFLRDGILSNCSFPVLYAQLDTFMRDVFIFDEGDSVNLYEDSINGWNVINKIGFPIKACRYCGTAQFFQWEGFCGNDKADKADWLIEKTADDR